MCIGVSSWLLTYLLKETAEEVQETACTNLKVSLSDKAQLVKVIKVLSCHV